MKDVYWAFTSGVVERRKDFDEKVRNYHLRIFDKDSWKPDEEVFPQSSIQICYEYWTEDGESEIEEFIKFQADNGESFTQGELLFKINNTVAEKVSRGDHVFFEGLNLSETRHDEKPFYWMYLGS